MARSLSELLDALPDALARQALTHASWVEEREASNERLEFLGDSVLGLSVTARIFERLPAERWDEGRLSKVRAQAVAAPACARVGKALDLPDRLRAVAPPDTSNVEGLLRTPKFLASVTEAVIGACFRAHGFDATASAVAEAFADEVDEAIAGGGDPKSELQEALAQRGRTVEYRVVEETGPPHDPRFTVEAHVNGDAVGRGRGRSKKDAERAAAREALEGL